jgi:hypothetical protein
MVSGIASARRRAGLSLLPTLAALAALCGCGSSDNGVASKSASEILAAARSAAEGASAVHISGEFVQGKIGSAINVDAASSHGARGTISLGSIHLEIILIGDTLYVKGKPGLPANKWVKGPTSNAQLAGLAIYITQTRLLKRLLSTASTVTKGAKTTLNGKKVVELKEAGSRVFQVRKLYTGSLYISTTGKPYPIQLVKRGLEHGTMTFSRWNEPVSLSVPAGAVDISQLKAGAR